MKKLFIAVCLLISSNFSFAHPQDGMSPEQLMFHYVKMFNEENLPALQDIFHSPHVRLISGKLLKFEDKSVPVVDFVSLKKNRLEIFQDQLSQSTCRKCKFSHG